MLIDIVILPPNKIRNLVSRATIKALGDYDYQYLIDNKKLIPHVSLFHINIKKNKLDKIYNLIEDSAKIYTPKKIFFADIITHGNGVWVYLSNNESLKKLNKRLVKYCAPLRDGFIPWIPKRAPDKLQKNNRLKYGTHYCIGKGFAPHFTMVKLKNEADTKIVYKKMKIKDFNFMGDTVAVCQINKYCQVTKVLKTFKLS